jgi:hypothetical protein
LAGNLVDRLPGPGPGDTQLLLLFFFLLKEKSNKLVKTILQSKRCLLYVDKTNRILKKNHKNIKEKV